MEALEGFTLQVSLECPSCHGPVHVQGLTEETSCPSCQDPVPLPAEVWAGWFEPSMVAEALGMEIGQARQITSLGGSNAKYALGRRPPRCQSCKTDLPMERLAQLAAAGAHACGCGERIAVREAPPLARVLLPGARWVVNEGPLDSSSTAAASEPVLMQCMSCGGALKVDGSTRAVSCEYCSASNYLPDGLWLRLHPPQKVRCFFVVATIEANDRLALEAERDPEAVAQRADIPVELLTKLAASDAWRARQSVASNPGAPREVLARLAHDPDSDVREAVAKNPACPVDILETLAQDDRRDVRRLVAAHPDAPESLLRQLVSDDDYLVRAQLVMNPNLPADALMPWLSLERDSDVLKAALKRQDLPVEVFSAWTLSTYYRARVQAAKHPGTPPKLLRQLAMDRDDDVLRALVARQDLDAQTVLNLASNEDEQVATAAKMHAAYAPAAAARRKRRLIGAGALLAVILCFGGIAGAVGLAVLAAQQLMALLG